MGSCWPDTLGTESRCWYPRKFAPDHGEFINPTYFVNNQNAVQRFRTLRRAVGAGCGVLLMSDGTVQSPDDRATRTIAPMAERIRGWVDRLRVKDRGGVL